MTSLHLVAGTQLWKTVRHEFMPALPILFALKHFAVLLPWSHVPSCVFRVEDGRTFTFWVEA